MPAPNLDFTASGIAISDKVGFDHISVMFSADIPYRAFECRATKVGETWGLGRGALIVSFSQTPANVERTFEIYDDYLVHGDGEYRISLFAQGEDGSWNDNWAFIPLNSAGLVTADGLEFLAAKIETIPPTLMFVPLGGDSFVLIDGRKLMVPNEVKHA